MKESALFLVCTLAVITACSTSADRAAPVPEHSSPRAKRATAAAAGQALQGDARRALAELESVDGDEFGRRDASVRSCMIKRFRGDPDDRVPDAFGSRAKGAIAAYQAYWRTALLDPAGRAAAEQRLNTSLARLAGLPAGSEQSLVDKEMETLFEREGFQALMGRTPPLLELIVWRKEARQSRTVPLPEGGQEVTVAVLDDFASLGWSAYATCDRSFTGGWVKSDAIYAVRPGWKSLEDENFLVSFLAHETQHFADLERFGDLDPWELEYRGKLAELALADTTTAKLLAAFASNEGDDPDVPHSYANSQVLKNLRRQLGIGQESGLGDIAGSAISSAARTLLLVDSERRARNP